MPPLSVRESNRSTGEEDSVRRKIRNQWRPVTLVLSLQTLKIAFAGAEAYPLCGVCPTRRTPTRFMKNSSRFEVTMARNLTRSSSGVR